MQAVGMMVKLFPPLLIHGFPCRRRMRAPGLRHVCCTHHQAFQSLSVRNAGAKLNKNRASPGFFIR
ncbi:hypothetical protein SynA1544_01133 [Synechococcus sp. A15-44]|nr:hypothetical protein SynA1544_01133 [Synechococcus sp. A15-44]